MSELTVTFTDDEIDEATKASQPQRFLPRPVGRTNLSVYDAEVVEFTKNTGSKYFGQKAISLELVGEIAPYQNAHFFVRVPAFKNWNVSPDPAKAAKHPNGFPTPYYDLLKAVKQVIKPGKPVKPDVNAWLGTKVSVQIGIEFDSYGFNKALEAGDPEAQELVQLRALESGDQEQIDASGAEKDAQPNAERLAELEEIFSRNTVERFRVEDTKLAAIASSGELDSVSFDN